MYKQLIIVRKDLNMSTGKTAAQVAHAAMAFMTRKISWCVDHEDGSAYYTVDITDDVYENWINNSFTKVVCGAKNYNAIMKAVKIAEELGLEEGKDFFLIKDNCWTELEPEEFDENGVGRTLTCIGFVPMDEEVMSKISKKFQLLK